MKYIVYLTTNLKSFYKGQNKIYIGVHKTENPDIFDGYLACGCWANQPSSYKYPKTPIQYAVKKYGVKAFKRQTLYIFDTAEEAYAKEKEIVNIDFINQGHVYNATIGGIGGNAGLPLYQFDLNGNLVKVWQYSLEAYEFYGIPQKQFEYAIHDRHPLLDSYWSRKDSININDYYTTKQGQPKTVHLYSKDGKWLNEFNSIKECAEFINSSESAVSKAVDNSRLVNNQYYISEKLFDEFIPKARKQYINTLFYIYKEPCQLIGKGIGKQIMSILKCNSWNTIRDAIRYKNRWYNDFYISETELSVLPPRSRKSIQIDVYDKYGNFIETLNSVADTKKKYKIHASQIKNIQLGDKYIGNYIFKYHAQ